MTRILVAPWIESDSAQDVMSSFEKTYLPLAISRVQQQVPCHGDDARAIAHLFVSWSKAGPKSDEVKQSQSTFDACLLSFFAPVPYIPLPLQSIIY